MKIAGITLERPPRAGLVHLAGCWAAGFLAAACSLEGPPTQYLFQGDFLRLPDSLMGKTGNSTFLVRNPFLPARDGHTHIRYLHQHFH